MPSEFEFVATDQDFFDKLLRDYRDQMGPELQKIVSAYADHRSQNDDDLTDFLNQQVFAPAIGVSRITNQSINDGTWTSIIFDTQDFASTDLISWDSATVLELGDPGIVQLTGTVEFAANGTGTRFGRFLVNGITDYISVWQVGNAILTTVVNFTIALSLLAGDQVTLQAFQSSGAPLNVASASLQAVWLGGTG